MIVGQVRSDTRAAITSLAAPHGSSILGWSIGHQVTVAGAAALEGMQETKPVTHLVNAYLALGLVAVVFVRYGAPLDLDAVLYEDVGCFWVVLVWQSAEANDAGGIEALQDPHVEIRIFSLAELLFEHLPVDGHGPGLVSDSLASAKLQGEVVLGEFVPEHVELSLDSTILIALSVKFGLSNECVNALTVT